ncbi:hypothetical protein COW36_11910 [bacterium (Candidatus Blackallbacteria) CG17_big_fil_post_rev_8_21_14_2_50_48_46]|uniref:Carrier domain-containing protein n=1 Tax=bacterium (Candidatus Blackallbacteria) CG17_big_fil_post_rev_8_21_14_2_50_48_46 TaxID=2014261 RepID=A0A2M7G3L4_9BACT|nr:MAG: hypothetical protein COW64_03350 [bacterium (Candidatus Blackallbacteria) CG18_big_fil_WC_8_21_14_2_50_49_26]PIW16468.1 MAG: hypothetical protein COW36_11910 [bacterium (Candidatus Blackallbacteria) CG17_big_fil_post_rev_8_21_14_2_50_48_46]PIW45976.1 MAG: hypothetical protein COW20_17175 [bacterium (Candidatus Blackallbacteria) CG13_big_fil_rev_8_21_14_2_50_49_14]
MSEVFQSFIEVLAERVQNQGTLPAVCTPEQTLSYELLWQEAGKIAGFLAEAGLEPGERIGLCLPKSSAWVIALIGIWRAGMVMVPLDPLAPADRLEWLLNHSTLATVLGLGAPPAGIPLGRWLDLALAADATPRLDSVSLQEGDPAYLIYTSGSTGTPKGVLLPHRGLVPVLQAQIEAFELQAGDRFLWLLSPLFDASLSDVGTTLLSGATLCLEAGLEKDLGRLYQRLKGWQITHTDLPPSLLPLLQMAEFPTRFKTLILGGEPSSPPLLKTWARKFRLINVYGPTETTICASLCQIDAETWEHPLLGRPLPGFGFAVLNPELEPVAEGETGELWISGPGLALGYISASRLTRECFRELNGLRSYRTGDRVKLLPGPDYVFLGRVDRQLKWHGQRLEPEEIEICLLQFPGMRRATVFLQQQGSQDAVLTAALQFQPGVDTALEPVRAWAQERLPAWMQPVRWQVLSDWPQTSSGKTDFEALQNLQFVAEGLSIPVNSAQEALILALWREILQNPDLSAEQSLDAHSLQKLEFLARCSLEGLHLDPERLAQSQNVRGLSQWLNQSQSQGMSVETLQEDVVLSASWRRTLEQAQTRHGSVQAKGDSLITGATGFVGRWLLRQLLEESKGPVHCLVRASSVEEGKKRILKALETTGPLKKDWEKRLIPWCGELEAEQWGLPNPSWKRLALAVDKIFHGAARVHLSEPYDRLRDANLGGTQTALKLQATGRKKILHYLSTLSVFVGTDRNQGEAFEADDLSQTRYLLGGYAQSKWAAEAWLRHTAAQAGPLQIYRLGLITGDTRTGTFPEQDWFQLMTRGLVHLGCLPEDLDAAWALDLTPVDYAARAIFQLAKKAEKTPDLQTFHIANPQPLRLGDWLKAMLSAGIRLEILPRAEWRLRLQAALQSCTGPQTAAALMALCRLLGEEHYQPLRSMDLFQTTGIRFDTQAADRILHPAGVFCPSPSPDLLRLYISRMLPES